MSALAAAPYIVAGADALSSYSATSAQASAVARQGRRARRLGDYNAKLAEAAADDAMARGREAKGEVLSRTRRLIGAQRASLAAQGLDVSSGTALDIQSEAQVMGELDALTAVNNATREAFGHRVAAWEATEQGRYAELAGENEASALRRQGVGTVLTRGLDAYAGWARGRFPTAATQTPAVASSRTAPRLPPLGVRDIPLGRAPGVVPMIPVRTPSLPLGGR